MTSNCRSADPLIPVYLLCRLSHALFLNNTLTLGFCEFAFARMWEFVTKLKIYPLPNAIFFRLRLGEEHPLNLAASS